LGPIPNPQSPIPNPQSPIPNMNIKDGINSEKNKLIINKIIISYLFKMNSKNK